MSIMLRSGLQQSVRRHEMVLKLRCVNRVYNLVLCHLLIAALTQNASARRIDDELEGGPGGHKQYTNGWAIRVKTPHDLESATRIAKKHGFDKVTKVRTNGVRTCSEMLSPCYQIPNNHTSPIHTKFDLQR